MPKKDLVPLRLRAKVAPFNAGEVAGFPPGQARRLVELRKAVYFSPPPGLTETGQPVAGLKPVHLGGGWYQVGNQKVKGKAKAQALADAG